MRHSLFLERAMSDSPIILSTSLDEASKPAVQEGTPGAPSRPKVNPLSSAVISAGSQPTISASSVQKSARQLTEDLFALAKSSATDAEQRLGDLKTSAEQSISKDPVRSLSIVALASSVLTMLLLGMMRRR
jgi:hypothetical protein